MKTRNTLKNLKLQDYVHPSEALFHGKDANQSSLVEKGVAALSDVSVELLSAITKGKYVLLDETSAPWLIELVADVCRILDYRPAPKLYVCHDRSLTISVGGTDKAQLLIPDYLLDHYDRDMLYYVFGNAITMLKAGHVKLSTICSVMVENTFAKPFVMVLEACMRAADMTSDRGGLLCCQCYPAAVRCLLAEAGIPVSILLSMDDAELETVVKEFLEETRDRETNLFTDVSAFLMRLNWSDSPVFLRLRELDTWYRSDYNRVLYHATGGIA